MPATNDLLGNIINSLIEMTSVPEPVQTTTLVPSVPIKLCLLGKPFSGKKTIGKKLADMYGLTLLSVDELVKESIK